VAVAVAAARQASGDQAAAGAGAGSISAHSSTGRPGARSLDLGAINFSSGSRTDLNAPRSSDRATRATALARPCGRDYRGQTMGRSPQQVLVFRQRGGKRKGAGRKPRGRRSSQPHRRRPALDGKHPVHVTLRVVADVGRLRKEHAYLAAQKALICTRRRKKFRVCHLSIQGNHIHLIVEGNDAVELAKGMQGFEISCAKHLNAALGRRGTVFPDRYHARQLRTPREMRNALAYVLNNWRRHGEDRGSKARFDRYSTGAYANVWDVEEQRISITETTQLLPIAFPTTWMLRLGWRRHGWLDPFERPGPS
jgi:REP element-mobilizing transposase RayT